MADLKLTLDFSSRSMSVEPGEGAGSTSLFFRRRNHVLQLDLSAHDARALYHDLVDLIGDPKADATDGGSRNPYGGASRRTIVARFCDDRRSVSLDCRVEPVGGPDVSTCNRMAVVLAPNESRALVDGLFLLSVGLDRSTREEGV